MIGCLVNVPGVPIMKRTLTRSLLATVPLVLCACGGSDLDAFEWDLQLSGTGDNEYSEELTYRLSYVEDSNQVNLAIGEDNFASGQISGCQITYQSVVWGEDRDGFELRWKIDGTGIVQGSTGGCETSLEEGLDWSTTEVFTIISSTDDRIPTGATYTIDVQGVYAGEVGQ